MTTRGRGHSLGVGLNPRDEIDLVGWVFLRVHLVENITKLKHKFMVLDLERFVLLRIEYTDGESHWSTWSA